MWRTNRLTDRHWDQQTNTYRELWGIVSKGVLSFSCFLQQLSILLLFCLLVTLQGSHLLLVFLDDPGTPKPTPWKCAHWTWSKLLLLILHSKLLHPQNLGSVLGLSQVGWWIKHCCCLFMGQYLCTAYAFFTEGYCKKQNKLSCHTGMRKYWNIPC